jgi:hypothetical protein
MRLGTRNIAWLSGLLMAAAIVLAGCSGGDNAENEGSVEIAQADGGKTILSGSDDWPKDWPEDIPRPEGMKILATTQSAETTSITLAVEIKADYDELIKLYQEFADSAGYVETMKLQDETTYMYSGKRGQEIFVFNLGEDQARAGYVVGSLVYDKASAE